MRYRLEGSFAHDITGKAISELEKKKFIKKISLPGRKRVGGEEEYAPSAFYVVRDYWDTLKKEKKDELRKLMKKKRELALVIINSLSEAGKHAEEAFWRAFQKLSLKKGWEIFQGGKRKLVVMFQENF